MPNIAIIQCVYNPVKVVAQSLQSLLRYAPRDAQIILVYNNPPWDRKELEELLRRAAGDPRVQVVNDGMNHGCHAGFNRGLSLVADNVTHVCKIDDDVVIKDADWYSKMLEAFAAFHNLAYVSSWLDRDMLSVPFRTHQKGNVTIKEPNAIVTFSLVMFRRDILDEYGPLQGRGLYGGEENHYRKIADSKKHLTGFLPTLISKHLGRGTHGTNSTYLKWKLDYAHGRVKEGLS